MYQILVYHTPKGNNPLGKFFRDLTKKNKQDEITLIKSMIYDLANMGLEIDKKYKNAIKPMGDKIYELRPKNYRVFFFFFYNDTIYLLNGFEKKTNKTPKNELDIARKYKKEIEQSIKGNKCYERF